MSTFGEYEQLAFESGAYRDIELDILEEMLASWKAHPGDPYTVVELRDGRSLAGFAAFSRVKNTDFTFDVRAICVGGQYRGSGLVRELVADIEATVLRIEKVAILRFEISRRKEDAVGPGFLEEAGYALIGHIEAFYEAEDDYYIYAKQLNAAEGNNVQETATEEKSASDDAVLAGPKRRGATDGVQG